MTVYRVAALLTCFNRCEDTLACLRSLSQQVGENDIFHLSIFLVDDGSSDGTSERVAQSFPSVNLLQGDGQLFWTGGTRLAFDTALADDFDYYLWVNDDTTLHDDALKRLVDVHQGLVGEQNAANIVVGSTLDLATGETTYGGVVSQYRWWPLKYQLLEPLDQARECDTMNGNCVLIPREVTVRIGNLDPCFSHYLGDFDYGLRIRKAQGSVWIAPGHFGYCEKSLTTRVQEIKKPAHEDLKALMSPKGLTVGDTDLTSFAEWKHFCKRHGGRWLWPIYWVAPYRRLLLRLLPTFTSK